jgi:hypothetical protein
MLRRLRLNMALWALTLGLSLGYAIDKARTEGKFPWEQALAIAGMISALVSDPPDKNQPKKSEISALEKDSQ